MLLFVSLITLLLIYNLQKLVSIIVQIQIEYIRGFQLYKYRNIVGQKIVKLDNIKSE